MNTQTTTSTAQSMNYSLSIVSNCETPSESEMRLARVANGEPATHVYQDVDRTKLDRFDENKVYEYIASAEHQAYVRLIVAISGVDGRLYF